MDKKEEWTSTKVLADLIVSQQQKIDELEHAMNMLYVYAEKGYEFTLPADPSIAVSVRWLYESIKKLRKQTH